MSKATMLKNLKSKTKWQAAWLHTLRFVILSIMGTWVALIAIIAAHIAILQLTPASHFLKIDGLYVAEEPDGRLLLHLVRRPRGDVDVVVQAELHQVGDYGHQPCIRTFRSTIEPVDDNTATFGLDVVLPNCDLTHLGEENRSWTLELSYIIELDYGIKKRLEVASNPFHLTASNW